jgi:hypothetical protein
MATLAAIYNDVVEAINDGGDDLDDARKLLEILDDHAARLGAPAMWPSYSGLAGTKPLPRRPENRRFVGAAYPSRAAAHNAEGATGTTPTHVKDTPAAATATRPKPGGGGGCGENDNEQIS